MGCCMGGKRNSNNTGGTSVTTNDPSDDGQIPAWSSPGGSSDTNNASNKTGGPYAGLSKDASSNFTPINTDGICDAGSIGAVSQQYESNGNAGSIGYDNTGGASYGLYQLSTSRGSVSNFMKYLQVNDPSAYANLSQHTAGTSDFNNAWKSEATNNSKFAGEQECFIKQYYYDPAVSNIKSKYGLDIDSQPLNVKQAVWSTAVQMGPDSNVFSKSLSNIPSNASSDDIINSIYDERGKTTPSGSLAYFTHSSDNIQRSVANRFVNERKQLLSE